MASMTFQRWEGGKPSPVVDGARREIRFDSSPKYSVCKQFGWRESSFRLEEESRDSSFVVYRVHASASEDCPPESAPMVGKLVAKTRARIWAEQSDPYHVTTP